MLTSQLPSAIFVASRHGVKTDEPLLLSGGFVV
jgi:hypothetical protein